MTSGALRELDHRLDDSITRRCWIVLAHDE
jgi:hypothetical protein